VTAKYILSLHSVLTPENQKLIKSMLNGNPKDFAKIAKFAQQTAPTIGS
jgi:predicted transcriptional regulator